MTFIGVPLLLMAGWVALPALVDLTAWLASLGRPLPLPPPRQTREHLLFLIPAHNEHLLIERCVRSLMALDYPGTATTVTVIADNCTDDTAALARGAGATVLERQNAQERGKGFAIGWALRELRSIPWDAVVIIDADTVVEPDYALELQRWGSLLGRALQTYDTASNEFENWLTRLAGLLTRSRYDIALRLKASAGLSCPLTGDGVVLGRDLLEAHPWDARTITEGWELYARLTLAGQRVGYAWTPVVYAQEAQSMQQSASQRERWTAGRLEVLRLHWRELFRAKGVPLLQRLDLVAELTSLGPIVRGAAAGTGMLAAWAVGGRLGLPAAVLFATGFAQPALYAALALRNHPEPLATLQAFAGLPRYAAWRLGIALRGLFRRGPGAWVRTARRSE